MNNVIICLSNNFLEIKLVHPVRAIRLLNGSVKMSLFLPAKKRKKLMQKGEKELIKDLCHHNVHFSLGFGVIIFIGLDLER